MRALFVFMSVAVISVGCQSGHKKMSESSSVDSFGKGQAAASDGHATCQLFGISHVFLRCQVSPGQGETLFTVLEIDILRNGQLTSEWLTADSRLSGESGYHVALRFRTARFGDYGLTLRGLPSRIVGDIFRGDPQNGGKRIGHQLAFHVTRELYWERIEETGTGGQFFAFMDDLTLWAIPIKVGEPFRRSPLLLQVNDRIPAKDLALLEKGEIINISPGAAQNSVVLTFKGSALNGMLHRASYSASVIEH